jgi:hypothetical protein
MQDFTESRPNRLTLAELQSRVPPGSASCPIAKWTYRLGAALRLWRGSMLRIMAIELCSLPLRILALLRTPSLRMGIRIPVQPEGCNLGSWEEVNSYAHACSEGMRQLQKERGVVSALECQTYCQGFQRGVRWYAGRTCNGKRTQAPARSS